MLKFEDAIRSENERFFLILTGNETFPFPPAGSRLAVRADFIKKLNGEDYFRTGVEFWAVNSYGFFDRFVTSKNTIKKDLDKAFAKKELFIAPKKQLIIE